MSNQLKALHDRMMANKPADAQHDADQCHFCSMEANQPSDPGGNPMGDFTQAQMDEAVNAAKAEMQTSFDALQARLAELEAAAKDTEVGKAVAEAIAAKDTEVADLQTKLDAAEAAKTAAEARLTETEAFWSSAIDEKVKADEAEARKGSRKTAAAELKVFTDEYIEENLDRFAAMSDDEFTARLEEWKLIASAGSSKGEPPAKTAFQASRQSTSDQPGSALHLISEMRREGQDPRRTA